MASLHSTSLVNLTLLAACGTVGWFTAAWIKPATSKRDRLALSSSGEISVSGSPSLPGVLAADARHLLDAPNPGTAAFDSLTVRYGSGSLELTALAAPFMDQWVAHDPAGAASEGIARALAHTPEILPRLFARLGAVASLPPDALLAAIPAGPLRPACISALATARGSTGLDAGAGPVTASTLSRSERSLLLREWHRARATVDPATATTTAQALTDPDDRDAALAGTLFAHATAEPEATLRASLTRHDFNSIAAAAFSAWIPRDSAAAWGFAATLKDDPRLPAIAAHMLTVESRRRRFSDALAEMSSLLNRLFPAGLPAETLAAFLPTLAAENPAAAQKYTDSLQGESRRIATVLLFDALCRTSPATAWRLATSEVLRDGAKDNRTTHSWTSATERAHATPQQRLAAGFPDLADMIQLAGEWLAVDPAAAIPAYCAHSVPGPLQRLIIETATSPFGAAIPGAQLIAWAKAAQPDHILLTIQGVVGDAK